MQNYKRTASESSLKDLLPCPTTSTTATTCPKPALFSGSILGAWYLYKGRIWQLIIARYVFTVAQYLLLFLFSFLVWM